MKKMKKMMEIIDRFKNMDMSGVSVYEAKMFLFRHAQEHGFDEFQARVIVKNVFGI